MESVAIQPGRLQFQISFWAQNRKETVAGLIPRCTTIGGMEDPKEGRLCTGSGAGAQKG